MARTQREPAGPQDKTITVGTAPNEKTFATIGDLRNFVKGLMLVPKTPLSHGQGGRDQIGAVAH